MIRIFIGIKIPPQIKNQIKTIYGGIPAAKWVDAEMLHITIKFLGEIDEVLFDDITALLDEIKIRPFEMNLKGLGFFKTGKTIRTLWLNPCGDLDPLHRLKQKIDLRMRDDLYWDMEDRKFTPHVTIAKINGRTKESNSDHKVGQFIEWYNFFETNSWQVDHFTLFRSDLSKSGSIYTPLEDYEL